MYLAKVYVTYKDSVLDPQGQAVMGAAHRLGYSEIDDVRVGKYFEIWVSADGRDPEIVVEEISDKLLANVNTETYRIEIERADSE
ncbi:phosphoribosylformylglycinamidine synthase subunit PurS [Actinomycetaceae bacterium MB13-C1-2]|nr:phosphoribosylformylglycinamidine synthase subunit PurS [Actinomycetaceae bacterium MB13-C1-2]